ncbi:MAG: lytic murein transglycosylase [Rhodospirillales bacterium]
MKSGLFPAFPMRSASRSLMGATLLAISALFGANVRAEQPPFDQWLTGVEREAVARGLSADFAARALSGVQQVERVIELDNKQPEFTQTFWAYLDKRVTDSRIERGRDLLTRHKDLFARIEAQYGVQARFLVAFWGLETNFGSFTGKMPMLSSLATLAYNPRRADFFREQLLTALDLMAAGDLAVDAESSWAGAFGNVQFMPTTFKAHAVDGDGDGKRDHFGSLPDIFASASNFLRAAGWQPDRTWGREVRVPAGIDLDLTGLGTTKNLTEWQALGVRRFDGRDLPQVDIEASLIMPAGVRGPAFLVYQNFRTIMVWNRSVSYAIAVGHLADRFIGQPPFLSPRRAEQPLSRQDVMDMQGRLAALGFETGGVDGILGSGTRKAIRAFQKASGLPADGHADATLLEAVRKAGAGGG